MTRPTEFVPEGRVLRETSTVGGTVVGPGSGGSGGGPADEVPISNGDGTATWRTITAAIVSYDNAVSGLVADDVQAAIDEIVAGMLASSGTHYEPLTSGASSAPELVFTADGRCVMVPVGD